MDLDNKQSLHNETCAIIVTYNPDISRVKNLISSLQKQQCDYFVIDNSPYEITEFTPERYKWLGGNKGIAQAQNDGILLALELNYPYIIFFDQDSNIQEDFVIKLLMEMKKNSYPICAPVFFDEKYGFEYAITDIDAKGNRRKIFSDGKRETFTSSVAISSGTLVKANLFESVGLMDSRLFIDYVDTEWCLRCFQQGISINIIPSARMYHSIGDNSLKLGRFRVPIHSAVRRYYRTRNSIHLLRYKHVPKKMAFRELIFSIIHNIILTVALLNISYLKMSYFAIVDGVLNRWGENKHI
ncbi:rhamnosyltransferase [Scandinavium sp. H11S7]|uniref:rhamnosyltransferase n=1 Tax=Scandinavium hiltneri TaxID=2926519 RepID=UPI0021658C16|nr:rhamnosyltransferase [Scandinavium hiltneri]MCS2156063.1 rhamnosyltransferase [Scandinavium hiltneri]